MVLQPLVKVGGREEKVADSGKKKKKRKEKDVATWSGERKEEENGNTKNRASQPA